MRLTVTVADRATPALGRLGAAAARPLEGAYDELVASVHDFWGERFASEGALGGSPWPHLSPATVRRHGPHPVLEDTGTLWASLTQTGVAGTSTRGGSTPYSYADLSPDATELAVGTRDPVTHLLGPHNPHVPHRQVQPDAVPDEWQGRWAELVSGALVRAAAG